MHVGYAEIRILSQYLASSHTVNSAAASCYQYECRPIPGYRSMRCLPCYQLTVVRPVVYHRLSRCKSVYGTESHAPLNMPKRREHSLIYAAVNLTPEYRPNRRLRLTFSRIEANCWQTRSIAWPLCNSREFLLWSKLTTCSRHCRPTHHQRTKFIFLPRLI